MRVMITDYAWWGQESFQCKDDSTNQESQWGHLNICSLRAFPLKGGGWVPRFDLRLDFPHPPILGEWRFVAENSSDFPWLDYGKFLRFSVGGNNMLTLRMVNYEFFLGENKKAASLWSRRMMWLGIWIRHARQGNIPRLMKLKKEIN